MIFYKLDVWRTDLERWETTLHSSDMKARKAHADCKQSVTYDRSKPNGISMEELEGKAGLLEWFNLQKFSKLEDK